jgi:hypothetical protein
MADVTPSLQNSDYLGRLRPPDDFQPDGGQAWLSRQQLRALYFAMEEDSLMDILTEDQGGVARLTAMSRTGVQFLGVFSAGDSEQYAAGKAHELILEAQTMGLVVKSDW